MYQQRNARNNADIAHEGQLTFKSSIRMRQNVISVAVNKALLLVPDGLVKMFQKELFSWDIKTTTIQ